MESFEPACPECGRIDTMLCAIAWDTDKVEQAAPPVLRHAESNAGRFYALNILGIVSWVLIGLYVGTLVDARPAAVIATGLVTGLALFLHVSWLLGHGPAPTDDQIAARDDWMLADADWQRRWICPECHTTFRPEPTD